MNLELGESLHEFDNTIKLHINTVKPYTGYGSGQYIISSVKQMSTTSDFLNFPEAVKKCQVKETIEECANRKILKAAGKKCKCLPRIVNQVQNVFEVGHLLILLISIF